VTFRYDKTLKDAKPPPEPTYWVIDRGMAILCLVLAGVAGFFVGAAAIVLVVTS
jgi:hypothetical protein